MTRRAVIRMITMLAAMLAVGLLVATPAGAATTRSKTFGGYEATPTATKSVVAQFVVPSVTCPASGNRGLYVFAGRAASNHLSQRDAGVFVLCQNGVLSDIPTIFAGSGSSTVNQVVSPGDHMRVQITTPGQVQIVLKDLTRGWTAQRTGPVPTAPLVQVGLNDLTINGVLAPIPNFGHLMFDSVTVSGQKLSARPHTAITKVNAGGTVQATPGAISTAGIAFPIAWNHA